MRVEPGGVRHRHPRPEDGPLEGPAEVPVAGEPQPASLGVADAQPLHRRGLLLWLFAHAGTLRPQRPTSSGPRGRPCRPAHPPARCSAGRPRRPGRRESLGTDVVGGARPRRRRRRPGPSTRRPGRSTRRWCRRCRWSRTAGARRRGRGRSRAASTPSWSGRAPAAARPTAPVRARRPGRRAGGSRRPPRERHLHGAELTQRPAYGALGRAEPPDEVGLRAGTERAQPALDEGQVARRGTRPASAGSPSQSSVRIHCGRETRQSPALAPRTIRPVAASVPRQPRRDRERCRRTSCPARAPGAAPAPGSARAARRWSRARPRPGPRAPRPTSGPARLSPSLASRCSRPPWPAGCAAVPATRAEALPHTAGSRSRGKAKRVRRIASCLTTAALVVERPVDVGRVRPRRARRQTGRRWPVRWRAGRSSRSTASATEPTRLREARAWPPAGRGAARR